MMHNTFPPILELLCTLLKTPWATKNLMDEKAL